MLCGQERGEGVSDGEKEEEHLKFSTNKYFIGVASTEIKPHNNHKNRKIPKSNKHIKMLKERAMQYNGHLSLGNMIVKYSCCNDLKYSAFVSNCKASLTFIR